MKVINLDKQLLEINAFGGVTATLKFEIPELDELDDDIVNTNDYEEEKEQEVNVKLTLKYQI